jgi:hypothetical protein
MCFTLPPQRTRSPLLYSPNASGRFTPGLLVVPTHPRAFPVIPTGFISPEPTIDIDEALI